MNVYMVRKFEQFLNKEKIEIEHILAIVTKLEKGLLRTSLGGNVYRIRTQSRNKSLRIGVAYRKKDRAIFLLGINKGDRENFTPSQIEGMKNLSKVYLPLSETQMAVLVKNRKLIEVGHYEQIQR